MTQTRTWSRKRRYTYIFPYDLLFFFFEITLSILFTFSLSWSVRLYLIQKIKKKLFYPTTFSQWNYDQNEILKSKKVNLENIATKWLILIVIRKQRKVIKAKQKKWQQHVICPWTLIITYLIVKNFQFFRQCMVLSCIFYKIFYLNLLYFNGQNFIRMNYIHVFTLDPTQS